MGLEEYVPAYVDVHDSDFCRHWPSALIGTIAGASIVGGIGFGIASFVLASGAGEGTPGRSAAITAGAVSMGAVVGGFLGAVAAVAFSARGIKRTVGVTWGSASIGAAIGVMLFAVIADPAEKPLALLFVTMVVGTFLGAAAGALVASGRFGHIDTDMVRIADLSTIGGSLVLALFLSFGGVVAGTIVGASIGYLVGAATSLALGAGPAFDIAGHGAVGSMAVAVPLTQALLAVHAVLAPLYEE